MDTVSGSDNRRGLCELPTASKAAIVLLLLVCSVDAADYNLNISMGADDFLGVCDGDGLNAVDGNAWGECIGNFVNPTIPNPIGILAPVTGDNLKTKIDAVNIINPIIELDISQTLDTFKNIPLVLIFSILELLASSIRFILVFAFKFIFVYLFYISLGIQSIILLVDRNNAGLQGIQKVHAALAVMAFATILTLAYGGAWITW